MEKRSQLLFIYNTVTILVKHIEGDAKVLLVKEFSAIYCGSNELFVVDFAIAVSVKLLYQIFPVLRVSMQHTQDLAHAFLNFINA